MEKKEPQVDYWRALLADTLLPLRVPDDGDAAGNGGVCVSLDLSASLVEVLSGFATRHQADRDAVLLAVWAALLGRLSGEQEIVVQAALSSGVAPLPVRFSLTPEGGLSGLLAQWAEQWPESRRHAAAWPTDAATAAMPTFIGAGAEGAADIMEGHPLSLRVNAGGDATEIVLASPQGFAASRLEQYLACYATLLVAALAAPERPVQQLPLLGDEQARRVLALGDGPDVAFAPGMGVHELVEAQVRATPEAVAIVDGAHRLTYAELNRRANRLAHHLCDLGVRPDDRVALYLPRSLEMVVGVLAALKAGAAYVPLDPTYPVDRLGFTLSDSRPAALLTQPGMETDWRELLQGNAATFPVLDMAAAEPAWSSAPEHDLPCAETGVTPRHLAYVLYTSGSTGKPKGVAMPHGPLLNLIQWQRREPGNDAPLRTLQFAALGFDVAFQEIFATLSTGGELHMVDQDTRLSAGKLFDFIVEHRIERMFLPYFALQMLAEGLEGHLAALPAGRRLDCALREVITAGEQLRIEPKIVGFFEQLPGCRLHNHYGPTETHVVTALTLPEDPHAWPRLPSIGRPIANARVYVLDAQGQPLPHGVAGELYLAGPVVARGYLQRPDLSAERFLRDPFAEADDARMYRTGDLGRWLPDGTLEYLGRQDFQVKIRGFRVELGEIEAQVMAFPGVREAGVLAREDAPGLKRLVAYLSPRDKAAPVDLEELRRHLVAHLPDYMVPVAYVQMDALPLSPNGKLDRGKLPKPGRGRPEWAGPYAAPRTPVETALCRIFADVLDLEDLGRDDNFFDLGGTSLLAIRVLEAARRERVGDVPPMALFRSPTPALLAAEMAGATLALDPSRIAPRRAHDDNEPIAIVAMAGRFPGAASVEALWENLCAGRDGVTRFAAEGLDPGIPESLRADPAYVPARGVFDDVDKFDAAFFGISPKEAELMDPQQRVFLELCWECIERAGHVPDATGVPVGVFAGMYNASYYQRNVLAHPDLVDKLGAFQVMLGNEKDYIATRVAHKLNLTGPAISVHTACSTSLVAIAQAIDSLRGGRCGMALAGGIAVTCPVNSGHLYQEGGMLSADGSTRSFDADATGTVFSDGAAVVLLKRLSDAIADGDPVHAVIRGAAVNNDGAGKASFTAPSSEGQAAVIAMAHADAGVEPRSIGYVETHGTATPMGDPIEIEGLTRAFRLGTEDTGFCVVGSVKSNLGHTLMAAGAAGVIKTAYALQHGCIPPTAHFRRPNPVIDFANTPFRVSGELLPWPAADGQPRRAGVSSFGVGGTNAHVVMEEAPAIAPSDAAEGAQLLVLSARTPAALVESAARLADHLDSAEAVNLADVAWTLAVGRKAFPHRIAVAAEDAASAVAQLRSAELAGAAAKSRPAQGGDVVFLFPGQGCQYAGMGRTLYACEPAFREAFDACAEVLDAELRQDLRALVFGDDAEVLLPTAIMQPAIFSIEYSLARWWMAQGVVPAAMVGHSVGEFVAATLAGVFALPDALKLVARRGRLMQAQPSGAMLSVRLPLDALLTRLPTELSLAAENAPGACVVAGPHEAVAAFQQQLEGEGVACRALKTSHAFHSAMMDAAVPPFRAEVAALQRQAPAIPIVSTATGDWLGEEEAMSAGYWARHLREPVRFSAAVARALESVQPRVLLEIGPRNTLTALSRQQPLLQKQRIAAIPSLADGPQSEHAALLGAFGQLWAQGVAVRPESLDRRFRRLRVRLPTYPFEKKRYWVEAPASAASNVVPHPALAARAAPELPMSVMTPVAAPVAVDRRPRLSAQLKEVFEDVAGFDLADAEGDANFIELGLDSLMLTQVALQLQKTFGVKISFRQLMGEYASLDRLTAALDAQLPPEAAPVQVPAAPAAVPMIATPAMVAPAAFVAPVQLSADGDALRTLIAQQMQLMSQQLALLAGAAPAMPAATMPVAQAAAPAAAAPQPGAAPAATAGDEDAALAHTRYDVKKAFGAIARIDASGGIELTPHQRERLDGFIRRYTARTPKSKTYTQQHRAHMADPRVVTGFRPLTKEIVYQIVVERSKGSHVWDIDGHEYVDALNGFGTSLFGWQPDFVVEAVKRQIDAGYEIGPMHPLAGEVCELVCELTGNDRAALCNTGSEAVLGAMRIARTVTGRETIVVFSGSYHGINDEVIVRGTKKLRAVPAAPGILRNTAEKVLVLDYGTPETLQIIRERAHELAAVLVEPVQSRRPDFQPVEFLKEVRKITAESGAALIFDEVITGFRSHPAGAQALFGIKADLATYGKVVGGGYPIGVMAGKREFMDALDGGHWQYGDESVPTVGVTYFAGTFVRHPLTLAAAKASLLHMKEQGLALQQRLNERTAAMAAEINAFCEQVGAPVRIKHFASLWRTCFEEEHPLQDLLFAMMRSRGIHILDNFPCFFTTAHSEADFQAIIQAYKESVLELQEAELLPRSTATPRTVMDADKPAVPGARLGRDPEGRPAWYLPDPDAPGQYLKVGA
ncbi:MAG: amino acid adenylation domain-containing protein [Pseudoxanthomonas sp.]